MQSLVFDFGNVVGYFDYQRSAERLARHTDLSAEEIIACVRNGGLEEEYESGRISSADFLRQVRTLCRLRCSEEELISAYADIFSPNRDVCDLLPTLKSRYKLLLGSNTCELHARQFQRQFAETLRHFDHLVLSYEIGVRKPKSGFFAHCQRLADCPPAECLFIDDLPENVAGAVACGWHGIVYRGIGDLRSRLAALGVVVSC